MSLLKSCLGFFIGLVVSLGLTLVVGENPIEIFKIILGSSFGSGYDLGLTLFYTTSLIFTGLSVSFAFKAGLFNIGAEGQLSIGALSMVLFGNFFSHLPTPLSYILIVMVGMSSGLLWGLIPGFFKAYRNSHEVIITMMMNFIAIGISSYFIINVIPNPRSQNPESAIIGDQFRFNKFDFINSLSPQSPINIFFILALVTCFLIYFFFKKTVLGFQIQAVGSNRVAAERAGINSKKIIILCLSVAGLLASGASLNEIVGYSGQYKFGFSPDFGFMGIAVALMSNNHPLGVILSAFLMATLHKGAGDLDLETSTITRDFSKIMQAFIIFGVGLQYYLTKKRK